MEEIDVSNLSDADIINMFPDTIESGVQIAALKTSCTSHGMYDCSLPGYACCTKPNCGGNCQVAYY